jgi:TetR/AcrR family transcriptional regulator, transcriptional repressor for nem operon
VARYEKDRKGETRRRIVELAARRFRAEGVDGVGIAKLMTEAGLTNGGFYAHFASKEELVKEAIVHAISKRPGDGAANIGADDLPAFIDRYLSITHRDHPEAGCAIAAMLPDLTRCAPASRLIFNEEFQATLDYIAERLPEGVEEVNRQQLAIVIFSHLLGTMQMARFITDAASSESILVRGRAEAKRLAGF